MSTRAALRPRAGGELGDQARLADARLARDERDRRAPIGRAVERRGQARELALAPDELGARDPLRQVNRPRPTGASLRRLGSASMRRRRLVRVPASSANLGPGFDAFACALALHMELEVEETGRFGVHTDLKIARDRRNLAVRGFARLADPEPFSFRIQSQIPLSGGLGSSAAAYVAGLMAADHLFELDADLLALATELEGHPDNVAAALHGRLRHLRRR